MIYKILTRMFTPASIALFTVIFIVHVTSAKIVFTEFGPVRGITVTRLDNDVEAYLGIPFATPPVGDLRFRKPILPKPWLDIYEANVKRPPCFQNATEKFYWMPDTENMTEDCLYLNVWVPKSNSVKPKHVVVWIHGGAFQLGSSDMELYDGATLAAYGDVIVVSINYRVGFFGFLYTPIEDAGGNMGLYDQVMALEWIKDNIDNFGGNPNEITLLGESAGSISINGHLVSPLTKNLFRRAIMHSGGAFHPLSFDANRVQLGVSNTLARITGCANATVNVTTNPQLVVDCLRQLPPLSLTIAEGILKKTNPLTVFPIYGDEYLPGEITDMVRKGLYKNTELLMGVNKDEGAFFLTTALPEYFGVYGHNGIHGLSKRLAHSLIKAMFHTINQNNTGAIADFYILNIKNKNRETLRRGIFESIGDYMIACSTIFFADFYSRGNRNVHFFKFSHRPSTTLTADWVGATHFDEVQYIFGNPLQKEKNYTDEEVVLTRRLLDRWLKFAKTGNPNIPDELQWPPYSYHYPVYLDIGIKEKIALQPDDNRCEFWRDRFNADMDSANMVAPLIQERTSRGSSCRTTYLTFFALLIFIFM